MVKETQLNWVAGLLDGEGWVGYTGDSNGIYKNRYPSIKIVNTEKELLEQVYNIFGIGSIHQRTKSINPKCKPSWVWSVYGKKAKNILVLLQPYIISPSKRIKIQAML